MTSDDKDDTAFAPAERESMQEIQRQADKVKEALRSPMFFDAVPNIFLILNDKRQIVFSNQAFTDLLESGDKDALLGMRPGEALKCTHAFESAGGCGTTEFCRNCGAVRAILSGLEGHEDVQECSVRQANGEALDLQVWTKPVDVEDEHFTTFAVRDISHEKRRRVLERIFFHDILNVAGGLRGFIELMMESPEQTSEFGPWVYNLTDRLIEEIQMQRQLLAAENGDLTLKPESTNALALVQELKETYQEHEVAKERKIQIAENARPIWFVTDETLLRRVLGNMVKNALEACQPGECVTLDCLKQEEKVVFTVHNPAFIPRDIQLQIFKRSFSTKGNSRGIGTYSMKLLTERYLKGQVTFTSTPETGTVFEARYPVLLKA